MLRLRVAGFSEIEAGLKVPRKWVSRANSRFFKLAFAGKKCYEIRVFISYLAGTQT